MQSTTGLISTVALAIGVTACSSSPAPWTRPDESPWSSKYEEQQQSTPEEVVVIDEPVVIEEPAPVEPDPEPVVAVAPVVIEEPAPEPEEPSTPEQIVLDTAAGSFAVQALAGSKASVEKFRDTSGLDDMMVVRTEREGNVIYVLVSLHADRAVANEAAAMVEDRTGNKPWVRSIESLQSVVAP